MAGDPEVMATFVRERGRSLMAMARLLLGDEAEVRRTVSSTFVATLGAVTRFASLEDLDEALDRSVVDLCLERRRARSQTAVETIEALLPRFLADGHHAEAPPATLDEGFDRERVRRCLDYLPGRHGEALLLCDVAGLSPERAAEHLGVGVPTLRRLRQRARLALQSALTSSASGRARDLG